MMKKRTTKQTPWIGLVFWIFLSILAIPDSAIAQGWPEVNEGATFEQVRKHFTNYWTDKTPEKGKGWKVYRRWEWFWHGRLMPDGTFPPATFNAEQYQGFIQKFGVSSAESSNSNWTNLGPNSSFSGYSGIGRINCIAFHPSNSNTMWAGAPAGGVWRTTNGGTNWTPLSDNLSNTIGVSAIAVDPSNANTLYIATGDATGWIVTPSVGVLKTTVGGTSWSVTGLSFGLSSFVPIRQLIINPSAPDTLPAAAGNGIYRTTNGGSTWTLTLTANAVDVRFKPGDPNMVYACTGSQKLYASNNQS